MLSKGYVKAGTRCYQRDTVEAEARLTLRKPPAHRVSGRLKCCCWSLFSTGNSGVEVHLEWGWFAVARSCWLPAKWKRTLLGAYTGEPCTYNMGFTLSAYLGRRQVKQ